MFSSIDSEGDIAESYAVFAPSAKVGAQLALNPRTLFALAATLVVWPSTPLMSQSLEGRVTDAASQRAVAGAVVLVLGERDSVLSRTIAGQTGQFTVRLPAAARAVRALHVGYTPTTLPISGARTGEGMRIELARLATLLSDVRVRSSTVCRPSASRTRAYALFEQIRHALLASVVAAQADSQSNLGVVRFVRYLDGRTDLVKSQDVTIDTLHMASRPFLSVRSLSTFADSGFVSDAGGQRTFFAPDAEVLFDDAFTSMFCIDLMPSNGEHPNQMGVRFARARRDAKRVDIEGEIWIDTLSLTLQDLNFRYVGLPPHEMALRPGGHALFLELPNGSVVVQRWSLRLVETRVDTIFTRNGSEERVGYAIQETGGELASIRWANGTGWDSDLGSLQLAVKRTGPNDPIIAEVGLEHTNYVSRSIAIDTVVFDYLIPGPYRVVVRDRELAEIGVALNTSLVFDAVRGQRVSLSMSMPSTLDYAKSLCTVEPQGNTFERIDPETGSKITLTRPVGGLVALFVYVTDEAGRPIANASVSERVKRPDEAPVYRSNAYGGKTDKGGRYFSCWNFGVDEIAQIWVRVAGLAPQLTVVLLDKKVKAVRIILPTASTRSR